MVKQVCPDIVGWEEGRKSGIYIPVYVDWKIQLHIVSLLNVKDNTLTR